MKAKILGVTTLLLLATPALGQDEGQSPSEPATEPEPTSPTAPDASSSKENNPESGVFGKSDYDDEMRPNPDALGSEEPTFQFGPTFQVGFPHPISYGLEAIYKKDLSFGFSLGSYKLQADPAEITITNSELHARWHPLQGSFFLGAAYGKQKLNGQAKDDVDVVVNGNAQTVPAEISMNIDSGYVTPHIGWFAVYYTGLVLSFELGAQIPIKPSADVKLDPKGLTDDQRLAVLESKDYKDLKKKADDAAKKLGQKTIPYITLFRIGYFF